MGGFVQEKNIYCKQNKAKKRDLMEKISVMNEEFLSVNNFSYFDAAANAKYKLSKQLKLKLKARDCH